MPPNLSMPFIFYPPLSQIANLQKEKAATVTRLKQQQNLYEAVRSDRNVHSKNLIETQASFPFFSRGDQQIKLIRHQEGICHGRILVSGVNSVRSSKPHVLQLVTHPVSAPSEVFTGHECLGAQDVIRNMKRRFKIMSHNIEKLKEDITIMDHSLVRTYFS